MTTTNAIIIFAGIGFPLLVLFGHSMLVKSLYSEVEHVRKQKETFQ